MVLGKGEVRKIASMVGGALVLGLGLASAAQAQTFAHPSATATDDNHTNFEFGVDLRHETNVAHTSDQGAQLRHIVPMDDRVSPDATLDVQRLLGRNKVGIQTDAGYDFYRRNTRLNRERVNVNAFADINLAVCDVNLTGGYARNRTDLANLATSSSMALISNVETKFTGGAETSCGQEIGLRPMGGVNVEHATNSTVERQGYNRDTMSYSAGLAYVHPSVGTLMAFGNLRQTRYVNALLADGEHNGFDVKSIGGRFTRDTGARLRGWAEVTYAQLNPRDPSSNRRFGGLNWSADFTLDVSSRLQAHTQFIREITSTAAADTDYHIDTTYSLDLKYALSGRLQLTLNGLAKPRSYSGSQGANGIALTSDHLYDASATLAFNASERLIFSLEGGYEERTANNSFYNYQSFNVQTGVRLKL